MFELTGKYTNAVIYADTIEEGVYSQIYDIINCSAFEGQRVVCMPDVHVGANGPCGLVATIGDYVCPEHIGVDIGCSVSMMILDKKIPTDKYADFNHKVLVEIPFGTELHNHPVIDERDFRKFLTNGFNRYRQHWVEMLNELPTSVTEEWITKQLKRLKMDEGVFYKSLGTVGGGNHFIEYDEEVNGALSGVTLHFGCRNFGVKVCKYWMAKANASLTNKGNNGKSNKVINGYLSGDNLKGYLCDMVFAELYAQYNHKTVQDVIKRILIKYGIKVDRVITSIHNYIDFEDRTLRKSSIRSYKGEELLIPFNMRDGIAICEGLSNDRWLNSCSHGAGRKLSRSKAKKELTMEEYREEMKNVFSTCVGMSTIDESPMAYKDTDEIKELIQQTCIIKTFLVPKINMKATSGEDSE